MCNFSMKMYKETVKFLLTKIKNKSSVTIEKKQRTACDVREKVLIDRN